MLTLAIFSGLVDPCAQPPGIIYLGHIAHLRFTLIADRVYPSILIKTAAIHGQGPHLPIDVNALVILNIHTVGSHLFGQVRQAQSSSIEILGKDVDVSPYPTAI